MHMKKILLSIFAFFAIISLTSCKFVIPGFGNGNTETPEVTPTIPSTPTPTPETYNITFVINGHGEQPDGLFNITKIPTNLPILTEKGWNFDGWYYDRDFSKKRRTIRGKNALRAVY